MVRHHQRPRVLILPRHGPVQGPVEQGRVHAGGQIAGGAQVTGGPRLRRRIGEIPRNLDGLEVHVGLTPAQDGTPLIAVVLGRAPGDAGPPHAGGSCRHVDRVLEVGLPIEDGKPRDVLGKHLLGRAPVVPPYHEHAGTQVMGAHGGRMLPRLRIREASLPRRAAGPPRHRRDGQAERERDDEPPAASRRATEEGHDTSPRPW